MFTNKYILLTIDVEDWFQVENFKPYIPFSSWPERELRVEQNTHRLLDLFDSCEVAGKREGWKAGRLEGEEAGSQEVEISSRTQQTFKHPGFQTSRHPSPTASQPPAKRHPKATFFILGWLADRLPSLVREIQSRGHEIASHGYRHNLPDRLPAAELKMDLTDSKKRLEDLIGSPVSGYRAPSFAINDDILKIIEDCGYLYDSSYNSFGLHGRYGRISLNGTAKLGIARKLSDNFYELPISNLMVKGLFLPLGGGAYFRLIPLPMFNLGIKSILQKEGAYIFYAHPWEFDPEQPRVNRAGFNFKFRHYTNLNKTQAKLKSLMESFGHCQFVTCSEYLERVGSHEESQKGQAKG